MKLLAPLLIVSISAVTQQSCSPLIRGATGRTLGTPDVEQQILGKWYMVDYQTRGSWAPYSSIEYEFNADGRFRYGLSGTNGTQGTWKISGNQLHQVWSGIQGLEHTTMKSEIFILSKSRLDLENLKKGRDSFYRKPKTKAIAIDY